MFEEDTTPVRNISNSEVTCWLSCRRQYRYAFLLELAPKETPEPLARGSIGHQFFEFYWRARMEGFNHEKSVQAGNEAFKNPVEQTSIDVVMKTQFFCHRYINAHEVEYTQRWKPLGVEQRYDLPLTNSLNMAIKYDLFLQDLQTDKNYILDYKFAYDFWTPEDHDTNGQMPKYIAAMQANEFKVDGGYLEEIRTRELGAEKQKEARNLWRRTHYNPSYYRKQSVLKQHVGASLEIEQFRALPAEEQEAKALPVLNKHGACKFCNFKNLCNSELEGATDLSVAIRVGYQQSTYGYNKPEDFFEIL